MEIQRTRILRGPNRWTSRTAIETTVLCDAAELSLCMLPGIESRISERFRGIGPLRGYPDQRDLGMAQLLELAALGLQAQAGCPVSFSRTVPTAEPGVFHVVVEYTEETVGLEAMEFAAALCIAARDDTPFDVGAALARLHELDEDLRLGPSTGSIVSAALARGIPYRRLTEGSLVQFGWGSRQRRIQAAETDRTGAIAETIAQDKELTKQLLSAAGVPVPSGRSCTDADDAWALAGTIGLPIVVKPRDGNQGKGVTVGAETREEIAAAFAAARRYDDDVIVERYVPGHDYRILVVGNRVVAAARRDPPCVIGDGRHTVAELVARVNADPRRGDGHATSLTRIRLDEIAIARIGLQGFAPDSVLPAGVRVVLRDNANLSTGGSATDVTDEIHPEVAARAVDAAQAVGLDICGIDVVAETLGRPLSETGGCFLEVNAAPGLRMHLSPSAGKPRPVGEAIIDAMFRPGDKARIPLVAVTGTNGKTTTVRLAAAILAATGRRVGFTGTDGVYVDGHVIDTGDCSGPRSARSVLMHPDADAAVLEVARGGLLREGLAFDRCDVAIVTNIGQGDHLGLNHIDTVDELAAVKRVIVDHVADHGTAVLNAADPRVAAMAAHCPGEVIFFARDGEHPVLVTHRARGERTLHVEDDRIIARSGSWHGVIDMARIPVTGGGRIPFQVDNVLAAVGAAWALGLDWGKVQGALEQFDNENQNAPGRFNCLDWYGATVIADYGHNIDAMAALVDAVQSMEARRRSVVISGAGDRRDQDIRGQTEQLAGCFDDFVLYEDQCQRGRVDGEVIGLLREGLGDRARGEVIEVQGEFRAIDIALSRIGPGDVCLILVDQVEEALAHIRARIAHEDEPIAYAGGAGR
ncbi:MAG: cyanophycin synthetase [Burkholderiaceae bacterium]